MTSPPVTQGAVSLGFTIDSKTPRVLRESGGGCRPASEAECALWDALHQGAVLVPPGWKLLKDTTHKERSWPQDASHENGSYSCCCAICLREFTGHKRRAACRVCAGVPEVHSPSAGRTEAEGAWMPKAIAWLLELAAAQEQTNRDCPGHAQAYPSWTERVVWWRHAADKLQRQLDEATPVAPLPGKPQQDQQAAAFRVADVVRLKGGSEVAVIKHLTPCGTSAHLSESLGGSYAWNTADLEHLPCDPT